jgi:sulfatase maturation enzyme AslB (radical SAM superfamily)
VYEQSRKAKNLAQGRGARMNCPSCLGRLWLQDVNGDFFKCALCQATGEPKNELASVIDIATARNLRNSRRAKKVVQDNPDGDAA